MHAVPPARRKGHPRGFYSSELIPLGALLLIIAGVLLPAALKARAKILAAGGTGGTALVGGAVCVGLLGLAMFAIGERGFRRYQRQQKLGQKKALKPNREKPLA